MAPMVGIKEGREDVVNAVGDIAEGRLALELQEYFSKKVWSPESIRSQSVRSSMWSW